MAGEFPAWSLNAAANASADDTINLREGMSPSSVNDSCRAMMAAIASYRDDVSGLLTTGGTSTAYTVTTNQGLSATPNDGQLLTITPHADNGIAPTLAADGGTAFAIQSAPGAAIGGGTIVLGTPYSVKFNLSASAWILHEFFGNPYSIPLGGMIDYFGTTAPSSNFVFPFGQAISRTTYAALFAMFGTTFGVGDGVTTFNIPDMRGRVGVGKDDMGGAAAGRVTTAGSGVDGATLGAVGGAQNVTISIAQLPVHTPTIASNTLTYDKGSATTVGASDTAIITVNRNFTTTPTAVGGSITMNAIGSGNATPIMPPTQVLNKLLRVF